MTAKSGPVGASGAISLFLSPGGALQWGTPCVARSPREKSRPALLIHAAKPLFAWSELEDGPQLVTIKEVLFSPRFELSGPLPAR
jgi:hypothetical protein